MDLRERFEGRVEGRKWQWQRLLTGNLEARYF